MSNNVCVCVECGLWRLLPDAYFRGCACAVVVHAAADTRAGKRGGQENWFVMGLASRTLHALFNSFGITVSWRGCECKDLLEVVVSRM